MRITAITKNTIKSAAPAPKSIVRVYGIAMIVSTTNRFDFDAILLKVLNFLRNEMGLKVTVAQCTDLLTVHPVKHAFLSGVAPCPHIAIIGQCERVIITQSDINYFES